MELAATSFLSGFWSFPIVPGYEKLRVTASSSHPDRCDING